MLYALHVAAADSSRSNPSVADVDRTPGTEGTVEWMYSDSLVVGLECCMTDLMVCMV
jgi:hypothetical protein